MGHEERKLEAYLEALKREIKQWERDNNGKETSWAVIEENSPEVAKKYRKYSKLKRLLRKSKEGKVDLKDVIHSKNHRDHRSHNSKHHQAPRDKPSEVPMTPTKSGKAPERPIDTTPVRKLNASVTSASAPDALSDSSLASPLAVGPTPQLNGRVLGIFDIQLKQSPLTPTKNKQQKKVTVNSPPPSDAPAVGKDKDEDKDESLPSEMFKTPTKTRPALFKTPQTGTAKRRLQFDSKVEQTPSYLREMTEKVTFDYEEILSDLSDATSGDEDSGTEGQFALGDEITKTPVQLKTSPNTLRRMIEPSPLIKRKPERSLYAISQGLKVLQKEWEERGLSGSEEVNALEGTECEDGEAQMPEAGEEGADGNGEKGEGKSPAALESSEPFDPLAKYRKKVKTIKRTTRRHKMKTKSLDDIDDELAGVDIQERIEELKQHKLEYEKQRRQIVPAEHTLDPAGFSSASQSDEESSEEETYERKRIRTPPGKKKSRGAHPLSNNFVRLKINMHHGGRFKRRRR